MTLFQNKKEKSPDFRPLAERRRPKNLEEFVGQKHLVGEGGLLREVLKQGLVPSMIFWGEPGCGKTTLARLLASRQDLTLKELSATESGVREVRNVIDFARLSRDTYGKKTIVFIDEIHRFSKSQQDTLLRAVEDGTIILIGATTENPSFEVIPPLLSRARIVKFDALIAEDLEAIFERAVS
jgi:putative ATPase